MPQPAPLPDGAFLADHFAAWRVERRSDTQILLDAGQTRLWLAVAAGPAGEASTTLLFGSAVVPRRPGGRFSWIFHALVGAHQVYSRQLLAAAARRIGAVGLAQQAA